MQIFPFPEVLDEESKSTLQSYVDPTTKFFQERVKSAEYDEKAQMPDDIKKELASLGAFGLQVPPEFNGLGVNNTQYARLVEIVGAHDLAIGLFVVIPLDSLNCRYQWIFANRC